MSSQLVVFGPAHAGKSTLVGYIYANTSSNFDFDRVDLKNQKDPEYEHSQRFAYIVDKSRDERERSPDQHTVGTSRYMHITELPIAGGKCTVFDLPGAEHRSSEIIRGMYYGDIGVFLVEITDFIKRDHSEETITDMLAQLFAWRDLRDDRNPAIIVLTKMDLVQHSKDAFDLASKFIMEVCRNESTPVVIPISIDVRNNTDENILTPSDKMPWYKGADLVEQIKSAFDDYCPPRSDISALMCIRRPFDLEAGFIVEGKLLKGRISPNDSVWLTPVVPIHHKSGPIKAKVATIHNPATHEEIDCLLPGQYGSLRLSDLMFNGRRIKRTDMSIPATAILVDSSTQCAVGRILRFEVSDDFLDRMTLLQMIQIVWFGRIITAQVIAIQSVQDQDVLVVYLDDAPAAVPITGQNHLSVSDFLLSQPGAQHRSFWKANLIDISTLFTLGFTFAGKQEVTEDIQSEDFQLAIDSLNNLSADLQSWQTPIDKLRVIKRRTEELDVLHEVVLRSITIKLHKEYKI